QHDSAASAASAIPDGAAPPPVSIASAAMTAIRRFISHSWLMLFGARRICGSLVADSTTGEAADDIGVAPRAAHVVALFRRFLGAPVATVHRRFPCSCRL